MAESIYPFFPKKDKKILHDPRVRVFYTDGRFFLRTTKMRYDVVFVDLPDPSTAMLNRYYTIEFFKEAENNN